MTHILTLIASRSPLSIAHIERCETLIEEMALGLVGKPVWIQPHKAADLSVANPPTIEQMKSLRDGFAADRLDILCSNAAARGKRLLIADMDATIVEGETLDDLAAQVGLHKKVAAITARAMNGDLDFTAAIKERIALLTGVGEDKLQTTLDETRLTAGALELVRTMQQNGARCVLVSGGFTFFTAAIARQCKFNFHHGNELGMSAGALDGTVAEPILDKDAKLAFLKQHVQELGIDLSDTIAIGDGANDLPMLAAAGLGIGYRGKKILEDNLLNIIRHGDLTAALYAQGLTP